MIDHAQISPIFGARISGLSFEQMKSFGKPAWQELLYDRNVIVIENIELSRNEFYELSFLFGQPWDRNLHLLHGEEIEEDLVVNWSDKSGLGKMGLPWHTDNPWHPQWRNPIRILYGVSIPDPDSGVLHYIDLSYLYSDILSSKERQALDGWEVLIQDYKTKQNQQWIPLIQRNRVNGRRGVWLTAMDLNVDFPGFKKDSSYIKGNTFLLKIRDGSGHDVPLDFYVEYVKQTLAIPGAHFAQKWKVGMLQVISNLNGAHYRTPLSAVPEERLIWRKTIAHSYQV